MEERRGEERRRGERGERRLRGLKERDLEVLRLIGVRDLDLEKDFLRLFAL